jgi:hypothetical protein
MILDEKLRPSNTNQTPVSLRAEYNSACRVLRMYGLGMVVFYTMEHLPTLASWISANWTTEHMERRRLQRAAFFRKDRHG